MFLNQPMITSLPRTRNDVGIHRKPAKIGITHKFEHQAGKRDASWQWGEYHDMDNGRVCERVNVGWMQGGLATRTARAAL
ncbi:hypothetical protein AO718_07635 [Aeromonas veronii]|nr:hypothetical protein AO718_07635 [Aeromonas veronii]KRV95523.1 hypothetical protein AO725_08320 [Aeromonas veronii]KRW05814.1 hypothetical protein AO745_10450 [Aeromonas veronii]KRW14277.1 hypothetical protein AO722_09095 [Aeromonas veronii]KRW15104.1 hypothetical protein AO732_14620 [Aeromonas veronii]